MEYRYNLLTLVLELLSEREMMLKLYPVMKGMKLDHWSYLTHLMLRLYPVMMKRMKDMKSDHRSYLTHLHHHLNQVPKKSRSQGVSCRH